MRLLLLILIGFVLTGCTSGLTPVPTNEADVAREAAELIRVSLTDRLVADTESYYRSQASSLLAGQRNIPVTNAESIVDEVLQLLAKTEHQRLVEALVPIYMRYYTAAEIHQLLSFYQTDVARKSMRVSPQIAAESQAYVRTWSEHFGATLMERTEALP